VIAMMIKAVTAPDQRFDLTFPAAREFDLVGFGQNAVDHVCVLPEFPRPDTKTEILLRQRLAGGQVATAVVFASRLGLKGKYVGKVGSDEHGRFCLEALRAAKIDISSLKVEEGARNHYSLILVDQSSGERTIFWERDPKLNFRRGELRREELCSGRALLLDQNDPEASFQAAHWAQEEGIPVVADLDTPLPGSEELMRVVDFLIVSAGFATGFTGLAGSEEALLAMRGHGPGFIATTLGAGGAMALLGDQCVRFPAFRVQAVDTTGAGDIFHGAFIYGLLQNWPLRQIITFANAAAALNCTRLGAYADLPNLDEIKALINSQPKSC
jgi:sulfofructose kinase